MKEESSGSYLEPWKIKTGWALRIFIVIDLIVLFLNFLQSRFQIELIIPAPGNRLNNPLAALLLALFLLGVADPVFRERWLGRLRRLITETPFCYYFFGALIAIEGFLEVMHFTFSWSLFWNLDREQGYGTYFSTIQLFLLGLVVLMVAGEDPEAQIKKKVRMAWVLMACMYFYLALDDCVGIHENFKNYLEPIAPGDELLHIFHEWLWVYLPFILMAVVFLAGFFIKKFRAQLRVMAILFAALILWVMVILLESLAKRVVDPHGHFYTTLLEGFEEGFEMLGATLFILGFSLFLRSLLPVKK